MMRATKEAKSFFFLKLFRSQKVPRRCQRRRKHRRPMRSMQKVDRELSQQKLRVVFIDYSSDHTERMVGKIYDNWLREYLARETKRSSNAKRKPKEEKKRKCFFDQLIKFCLKFIAENRECLLRRRTKSS
jgi:hypothetical protein